MEGHQPTGCPFNVKWDDVTMGGGPTLPVGPVRDTESEGLASHRKLEHTPFLAGSCQKQSGAQALTDCCIKTRYSTPPI